MNHRYLTAQEIAEYTGRAINTVYWLAHKHEWRRTDTRPQRYRVEDVVESLSDTPGVKAA